MGSGGSPQPTTKKKRLMNALQEHPGVLDDSDTDLQRSFVENLDPNDLGRAGHDPLGDSEPIPLEFSWGGTLSGSFGYGDPADPTSDAGPAATLASALPLPDGEPAVSPHPQHHHHPADTAPGTRQQDGGKLDPAARGSAQAKQPVSLRSGCLSVADEVYFGADADSTARKRAEGAGSAGGGVAVGGNTAAATQAFTPPLLPGTPAAEAEVSAAAGGGGAAPQGGAAAPATTAAASPWTPTRTPAKSPAVGTPLPEGSQATPLSQFSVVSVVPDTAAGGGWIATGFLPSPPLLDPAGADGDRSAAGDGGGGVADLGRRGGPGSAGPIPYGGGLPFVMSDGSLDPAHTALPLSIAGQLPAGGVVAVNGGGGDAKQAKAKAKAKAKAEKAEASKGRGKGRAKKGDGGGDVSAEKAKGRLSLPKPAPKGGKQVKAVKGVAKEGGKVTPKKGVDAVVASRGGRSAAKPAPKRARGQQIPFPVPPASPGKQQTLAEAWGVQPANKDTPTATPTPTRKRGRTPSSDGPKSKRKRDAVALVRAEYGAKIALDTLFARVDQVGSDLPAPPAGTAPYPCFHSFRNPYGQAASLACWLAQSPLSPFLPRLRLRQLAQAVPPMSGSAFVAAALSIARGLHSSESGVSLDSPDVTEFVKYCEARFKPTHQ